MSTELVQLISENKDGVSLAVIVLLLMWGPIDKYAPIINRWRKGHNGTKTMFGVIDKMRSEAKEYRTEAKDDRKNRLLFEKEMVENISGLRQDVAVLKTKSEFLSDRLDRSDQFQNGMKRELERHVRKGK